MVIESPDHGRPPLLDFLEGVAMLECLRITLEASGVPRAYPFAGKGEDRQKDREATLHIAEATLGMHSNYRTSRYPLLKTMVAVHNYPGSFSENILNVKR